MLNILIVEDELLIAEMLKDMLSQLEYNVVAVAKDFNKAVEVLKHNNDINFVFLDITLKGEKSGLDIANHINDVYNIPFVFLTSHSDQETIKSAVSKHPHAYLIKPFTLADIFSTLELLNSRDVTKNEYIVIKDGYAKIKIDMNDIIFIKSDNIYIEINTKKKNYLLRNSLDGFMKEYDNSNFVRVHRSYIVNLINVQSVSGQTVIVDGNKVPFSRKYKNSVEMIFEN